MSKFYRLAEMPTPDRSAPVENDSNGIDRFVAFITERECIRLKKEGGSRWPWTSDTTLRDLSFTNVRREHDWTTRWLAENWRTPHKDDPDLWFAMAVARFVNWPGTLAEIGYPVPWQPGRFLEVMGSRKAAGAKCFSGAYVIRTDPTPGQVKAEYLAASIFAPLWEQRERVRPVPGERLADLFARLADFHGIGGFMAAQIVADVKQVAALKDAPDWWTFAASGNGSRQGLCRVLGLPVIARDRRWPGGDGAWLAELHRLQAAIEPELERVGIGRLCAQDLQNCLCEFSKYERTRLSERKPKRRYKPPTPAFFDLRLS